MTYEVYIDVRHHPRHCDDWEERMSTAFKLAEPTSATPTEEEKMQAVAYALHAWSEEISGGLLEAQDD